MEVVDEAGQLDAELQAAKPKEARLKALKAEMQGWADQEFAPNQRVLFEGSRFAAEVSARSNRQRIRDMAKLLAIWGKQRFLELCSVTLKAAKENLTAAQYAECVIEEPNAGDRTVKLMQRATPIQKRAVAA